MRRPYADILGRPGVPRLLSATVIGRMPIGMGALAIFLLVRGGGGSYTSAGIAVGVATLSGAVGAPLFGRLVDRYGQPQILLPSAGLQALALTALAITAPSAGALLLLLCACYGFATPPLSAALRATWATVLQDRRQLSRAFSLDATVQETIWIAGPLLTAWLAAALDPRIPLIVMAASSIVGVVWFSTSATSRGWRPDPPTARHLMGPLVAGPVRRVLLSIVGLSFAFGALEFSIAATADANHDSAGPLLAIWAAGSVVGGLGFAARNWQRPPQSMLVVLLVCSLVGFSSLLLAQTPWQLAILLLIGGVFMAPLIATLYVLIEQLAPRGTVTEAFTWVSTTFMVGIGTGVAAAGLVTDAAGPRAGFVLGIVGGLVAVLAVVINHGGLHQGRSIS